MYAFQGRRKVMNMREAEKELEYYNPEILKGGGGKGA